MRKGILVAVFAALLASPGSAESMSSSGFENNRAGEIPVLFDALIMRPLGLGMTAVGFGAWAVSAPILAITRPTDMHKTFKTLVVNPFRFACVDPLGYHPNRVVADRKGEVL